MDRVKHGRGRQTERILGSGKMVRLHAGGRRKAVMGAGQQGRHEGPGAGCQVLIHAVLSLGTLAGPRSSLSDHRKTGGPFLPHTLGSCLTFPQPDLRWVTRSLTLI